MTETRYFRLVKEGGWVVLGQFAAVLGAVALVRVLTEYLNPLQYGHLALGLTVANLVNQVVMGGVRAGISRYYSIASENKDLNGYLRASGQLLFFATLTVLCIGSVLLIGLYYLGYSRWMGLAAAALIFSVVSGYNISLSGIQNAARQRVIVAFHGSLDAWLKIFLAVAVMIWLGTSSTSVVIGYALSSFIVTGSQLVFLKRMTRKTVEGGVTATRWVQQMWSYAWPFSAWGFFTWMQQSSDRWTLELFSTTEEVGLFAVLFQLGYVPITMASNMSMTFIGPILFQQSGDATDHSRNAYVKMLTARIVYFFLLVTVVAFMITLGLHKWMFQVLVAEDFRRISYLLPWVILAGGIFATGQIIALKMMSDLRSRSMLWAKIGTSLLGVIFNILGALYAGIQGIVIASIMFSLFHFFWMYLIGYHSTKSVKTI
jgi:O-antigen/teichoic acid export membrane protein